MILRYKRVRSDAVAPTKKEATDAGWDICTPYGVTVEGGGGRVKIDTGLVLWWELSELEMALYRQMGLNWYGQLLGKSRLGGEGGVAVLGGVVDMRYRGPSDVVGAVILNTGDSQLSFAAGASVCQLVPVLIPAVAKAMEWIDEIEVADRGGFGVGTIR